MIQDKSILAIIPARGGSKGIPRKNIREIAGKPLLGWTAEQGHKSSYIDRLVLSTDDEEIAAVGRNFGVDVPFMRPAELALDTTPGVAPVIHMVDSLDEEYDYVVLLQPTSPLRTAEDIDECIEHCIRHDARCCVSMVETACSPYWTFTLNDEDRLNFVIEQEEYFTTRQQQPKTYEPNGAVYIAQPGWLRKTGKFLTQDTVAYIMSREKSWDIDEMFDLEICEMLLKKRQQNI